MKGMARRKIGVALVVLVAGLGVVAETRAESGWLNLHFEGGPAFFVNAPQRDWFGVGGGGAFRFDFSPIPFLGFQGSVAYLGFPSAGYTFEGTLWEPPSSAYVVIASAGIRLRLLNDQNGYALPWRRRPRITHRGNLHGNLWVDASFAYVRTGTLNRMGIEAGLGYEMSVVDGLQLGPFARYFHVFQPDDQLDGHDAIGVMAGLSFTVAIPSGAINEPFTDRDGDGLLDPEDQCPDQAEDRDEFEDEDGCPDPDNDGDGVPDVTDDCPLEPEDLDEFADDDGCPELDNDGDGLSDADDLCPNEPEDLDGFEDVDGCPDTDNDSDGIADIDDACPGQVEVVNGVDDEDGCPDEADIEVVDQDILLRERVFFEFRKVRLRRRSWGLLRQIAQLLRAHPEYEVVAIEGHCDFIGSRWANQWLSRRRAEVVRDVLVQHHEIDPQRFQVAGFGSTRPMAQGRSDTARARNRRVEFRVVTVNDESMEGRARPRQGRHVAPELGPGGVVLEPGEEQDAAEGQESTSREAREGDE
jgi:outer membrane protein OmpA-like peptidoglycan-associated protein